MKKLIPTSAILFFVIINLNAQVEFGVSSGVFQSKRVAETLIRRNGHHNVGFYVGLYAEKKLSEKLALHSGISYFYDISYEDHIEVPLELKYKLSKNWHLFFGPNLSFLVDKKELDKSYNIGVALGLSYNISNQLSIYARYNYGLSKLYDREVPHKSIRINRFQIGLRYRFN